MTVVVLAILAVSAPRVQAAAGLGGGTDFQPGSTFPFAAGQAGHVEASMFVQNIGTEAANVEFSSNAPAGVTIKALVPTPLTVPPSKTASVPFAIETTPTLATGSYNVIVALRQTNIARPSGGGSAFAPAITGRFVVVVSGQSGTVTVNAVNSDDQKPVTGTLTFSFLDGTKPPVTLATVTGSTLHRTVVPGTYRAAFTIPGVAQTSSDFPVAAGENKTVTLTVQGVHFLVVAARPVSHDGAVESADLAASVRNNISRLAGPVSFLVTVSHDGRVVDHVTMAKLAELATGTTEQRTSYRPADGFSAGKWTFGFTLSTPTLKVAADTAPAFTVPGGSGSSSLPIVIGVVVVLLLGSGGLWWFLAGRRRRRQEPVRAAPPPSRVSR